MTTNADASRFAVANVASRVNKAFSACEEEWHEALGVSSLATELKALGVTRPADIAFIDSDDVKDWPQPWKRRAVLAARDFVTRLLREDAQALEWEWEDARRDAAVAAFERRVAGIAREAADARDHVAQQKQQRLDAGHDRPIPGAEAIGDAFFDALVKHEALLLQRRCGLSSVPPLGGASFDVPTGGPGSFGGNFGFGATANPSHFAGHPNFGAAPAAGGGFGQQGKPSGGFGAAQSADPFPPFAGKAPNAPSGKASAKAPSSGFGKAGGFGQAPPAADTAKQSGASTSGHTFSSGFGQAPASGGGFGKAPASSTDSAKAPAPGGFGTTSAFGKAPAGTGFGKAPASSDSGGGFGSKAPAGTGFGKAPAGSDAGKK